MKKWLLIIIFAGMVAWTLYETLEWQSTSEPASETEEESASDAEDENQEQSSISEDDIGLNEGDYAPDFTLETLAGEEVSLWDFRGQKVMVNFWATWCPPCRAEMPDMQEMYEEYDDIKILAVNLTETEPGVDQVEEFTEDFGLTFPILLDHEVEVAGIYDIQPIPTSYMIDSEGKVQSIAFGALNKDMMVQRFENMD
ncbi:redoxin domain-containing protein [Salipaludibacillus sp. CUR1]|uniref:redoxin domain-containing protein n=1 Tax=Salipaludibacillus sp. CUR1 TaxID=2820003 RepID=UPI001E43B5E6|nr:redoxin domain-containing protein [Salipaludibacillus sp. CUR1]MCE7793958.1 redoxin domain-containing protein [Salipaludibacillus sp. CUR1]